jgi:hypothetical protein
LLANLAVLIDAMKATGAQIASTRRLPGVTGAAAGGTADTGHRPGAGAP